MQASGSSLVDLGFSRYEAACYMALRGNHPVNGSRLSRISGIARSRIYDVLRGLTAKGFVLEVSAGRYVPLPADELVRRLRQDFEARVQAFEKESARTARERKEELEFIWTLTGYDNVMEKARHMIREARTEIYARLFPEADRCLADDLVEAESRGVAIRYIAMGAIPVRFPVQVAHPGQDTLIRTIGGRSFDIITDKSEALVGIFEVGNEDDSPVNWTRNRWFVTANRDSLRHDFYHCFLAKTLERGAGPTEEEKRLYRLIEQDDQGTQEHGRYEKNT